MSVVIVNVTEQPVAFRRTITGRDGIAAALSAILPAVWQEIAAAGAQPVGPPYARYLSTSEPLELEAGLPVAGLLELGSDSIAGVLPGGRHAVLVHIGQYEGLPESWAALESWVDSQGEKKAGPGWESYVSDPGADPDPASWRTELHLPLA